MEARLKKDSRLFQNLILHLNQALREGSFFFEPDKIRMQRMDPTHVGLVDVSLDPSKMLDSYQCSEPLDGAVNLFTLKRIFQKQNDDALTRRLVIESAESSMLSVFSDMDDSFHQSNISLASLDDDDYFGIPHTVWDCTITMPSELLRDTIDYIRNNKGDGTHCTVRVTQEGIYFTVHDGRWSSFTKLLQYNEHVVLQGEADEKDILLFIDLLYEFVGKDCIFPTVSLSMKGDDHPVMFQYEITDTVSDNDDLEKVGTLNYYMAPGDQTEVSASQELISGNQARKKAFEAHLAEPCSFVHLISSLCNIVDDDAEVTLSKEGIQLLAVDSSRRAMVDVILSSTAFDHFCCNEQTIQQNIPLQSLNRILSEARSKESLALSVVEDGGYLLIRSESPSSSVTVHEVDLRECQDTLGEVPASLFHCTVTMPAAMWETVIKDLKGYECTISICTDGALFESESNISLCVLDTQSEDVAFDVQEATEAVFTIRSLESFLDVARFASTVSMSIGANAPLKLECDVHSSDATTVKYYAGACSDNSDEPRVRKLLSEEAQAISSKLKGCKEVTVPTRKRARKIPATRKRKRSSSSAKKPAARKQAPVRTKPKLCSVCKQVKPVHEFFPAHLRKTTKATCIACLVVRYGTTMSEWEEPKRVSGRRGPATQLRKEVRCLRSFCLERYECPLLFEHDSEGSTLPECTQASFVAALPDLSTLAGSYDIVYTYSRAGQVARRGMFKRRSTKGMLNLQFKILLGEQCARLHGHFETAPALVDSTEPGIAFFAFAQTTNANRSNPFEVPIQVTGSPEDALIPREGHTGAIRMLARRTATRWNPNEQPWNKSPISFDNVDEAKVLTTRRKEMFIANSWIKNHLGLPQELAMMIHEYIAFRPPLAFFFEKGDLWIDMNWKEDESELHTIFVARRRQS